MLVRRLNTFWQKKQRSLSKILQKDIGAVAAVLEPIAFELNLTQKYSDQEIQWYNKDGNLITLFFYITEPYKLRNVLDCFARTKEVNCPISCIFVHQWMDGEGSWDVFALHKMGLVHWNRFWGNRKVIIERGGHVKDQFYNLFTVGKDFPLISKRRWARLFEKSPEKAIHQLEILANEFECIQEQKDEMIIWQNSFGEFELMFSILPDPPTINHYLHIYDHIKHNKYPVTFVFQKEKEYLYNIFRFSARSYLEHHNQIKL